MDEEEFVDAVRPWLPDTGGPLRAHLALAIRQAIGTGQIAQGARLPPERSLARALHVSRPTISGVVNDLRGAGLITSRQGSGSWVSGGSVATSPTVPFVERLQAANTIDLASATAPDATLLPTIQIETGDLLRVDPANGFTPLGMWSLRDEIAKNASKQAPTKPDQVIVTSGAHQALALTIAALAPRGSTVLLEDTTYGGLVDMVHANQCHPVGIDRDSDGPNPDHLRTLLDTHKPSLIVLISPVHSPTGGTSSAERSADIAKVLESTNAEIVLDETFADLEFQPTRRALSQALGARAIRTGSLSKSIWTGLRTGWIIADPDLVRTIGRRRWQQFDLGPSIAEQLFGLHALDALEKLLPRRRASLVEKADWMRERIASDLPAWRPHRLDGGLALWISIPGDGEAYAEFAQSRGVSILPGQASRVDQRPTNHLRLCFDRPIDVLEEAFDRLSRP